nr:glucose-methanol-choline oxidoreductase, FAD/NAD(P)-binding domain protein [Tanacetum cinerariifolium]
MLKKAGGVKKDTRVNEVGNPYVHVVKGQMHPENKESKATPTLVLSDECLLSKDLSKSLFGRVKQFALLANIRKAGELLDINDQDEMCFHSKRLCIYTKSEMNIFEEFKIIFRGRDFWIRAKEAPGWVLDFMEENDDEEHNDNGGFNVHESGSCGGDSDVEGGMTYDDICPSFEKKFNSNVAFLQKTNEQMDEENSRALKRLSETQEEKAAKKQKLDEDVAKLKIHL